MSIDWDILRVVVFVWYTNIYNFKVHDIIAVLCIMIELHV